MALTKGLLRLLDDEDAPVAKRLKIADNAFKSIELPIHHREAVLLKWIGDLSKTHDEEVWNLLLNWLTSQQVQDLTRNDITHEDLKDLMQAIIKYFKSNEIKDLDIVLKCSIALINNPTFQLFFKYFLEEYCSFIANILLQVQNIKQLEFLVQNEQLFNRNIIYADGFYKQFIEIVLPSLSNIIEKFPNDKSIHLLLSQLIEKCIFYKNYQNFLTYFKQYFEDNKPENKRDVILPKLLFTHIQKTYNKFTYKLVFQAFCMSYSNNFEILYKGYITLVINLGFDVAKYFNVSKSKKNSNKNLSLNKSIEILSELCDILIHSTCELNAKVNEKSFTEFLQILTHTIIELTKHPNENAYSFLNYVIILDPLIMEKNINKILTYSMLKTNINLNAQYELFLVELFKVFAKLHRIPNLIAKMIPVLKTIPKEDSSISIFEFKGSIEDFQTTELIKNLIPNAVLNYFTECITTLASWQVINLFKTLIFHLGAVINSDLQNTEEVDTKVTCMETISTLLCQFLSSVRISEHTVPTLVVEKFIKCMEELRIILGQFGTALVNMEHNPVLMKVYLNMCYTWGDLYVTLTYYSNSNQITFQKILDSDTSACNITYIHSYLSRDQWSLISQRIANFGEKPCKKIMLQLCIQKLRAMLLLEETVSEDIKSSIKTHIISSLDDNWKDILSDKLILNHIMIKSESIEHITHVILEDIVKHQNYSIFELLLDYKEFVTDIIYVCLSKITKYVRGKQKREQNLGKVPLCSQLFTFISNDFSLSVNLEQFGKTFGKQLLIENNDNILPINEKELSNYLNVIKRIPIIQFNYANIQEVLILFLLCLHYDMKCNIPHNKELIINCEAIVIGILQNCKRPLKILIKPFITTRYIIENFSRIADVFGLLMDNIFKNEESAKSFKKGLEFITENLEQEKFLQCAVIIENAINKFKKTKISEDYKTLLLNYQEELYKHFAELIKNTGSNSSKMLYLTETYTLTLKYYLVKDSTENLNLLYPFLLEYIQINESNYQSLKGTILLFTTILRNRSKIQTLPEDVVLRVWKYCQKLTVEDSNSEDYSKLIALIFEHIPNEQFSTISTELLKALTQQQHATINSQYFLKQLKIWNAVVFCTFNPVKVEIWQKVLESFLFEIVLTYMNNHEKNERSILYEEIVNFENNMIQNVHLLLTPSLVEACIITVSIMLSKPLDDFTQNYSLCTTLFDHLLKFRRHIIMDYLPSYLQRYRSLLTELCIHSNSDLKLNEHNLQMIADCALKFEKLTRNLVSCNKPIMRISPFLIADILKQYEKITLYPTVKIHLNNCLYNLMSLCDEHANSYLMRVLSTASTEMFKLTYDNYKKYYKFTGKV